MGWNILRGTPLKTAIALLFTFISVIVASEPLPPENPASNPTIRDSHAWKIPMQNHAASKAWSVGRDAKIEERPEVSYWIDRWTTREGRTKLKLSSERSFDFRMPVDAIIRQSGLPWELVAIPVVESNWRINAVSSSGAAGPWQFLEASARGRNLRIDAWRDDRRDVWRSTEAAMKELAFYDRLFSNWLIAVASYNAGPTRMRRLKEEGGYTDFWSMLDAGIIPHETRNYVPQVIAVAYIQSHAGRLGIPLEWEKPEEWVRIPADRSVSLRNLADIAGVETARITEAHRELNHPVTPPPTLPYELKVPATAADDVVLWLSELEESDAPERFWRYTVRSGDTLSEIASRSGISLSDLLSYNGHVRSGFLRIGERLYVPGSDNEPPGMEKDELPVWIGRYRVQAGDSFWSIARRFRIPPEYLAEANHRPLNGTLLLGSILKVPGKGEEM